MSDLDIQLLPWQQKVWADPTRFKVIAAGRRCGKSQFAAYQLLVKALQSEKGHVFYIAHTQGQARDVMWGVLMDLGRPVIKQAHINNLQITLVNGATISLKGSDRPDTMRGVALTFVVLDEYAGMKPDVWEEVIRPALSDLKGDALFIGTPTGRNHFWEIYKYAELSEDEDWKAWHLTSYDNPLLDPKEIEGAKSSMSAFAFRQEYLAAFEAKESEMFKEEDVKFSTEEPKDGDYFIAIDLAGFENAHKQVGKKKSRLDETSIAIVKVNEDKWYVKDIQHGRWDLNETTKKIFEAVQTYKPIKVGIERGIAQQAVMSPLSDLMKLKNRWFNVELLTHGNQKKTARILWALQGRFENDRIRLNEGEWNATFLDQLFQIPSPLTHDDLIDSLAYIDQLVEMAYVGNYIQEDEWEPLDMISGY